ncbi:TlpA family protein disulfide reductase [Pelagibaculum spongiae]|nr:TlpA disulfide reductase family protein [Pelagibaculum spongiae]
MSRNMLDSGVQIPAQQLPNLSGELVELQWPSESKRTLVYFFAPWCTFCKVSMPGLNFLLPDSDQAAKKLNVIAIGLDYQSQEEVQTFIDGTGFTGQVLLGNRQLAQQFQVQVYPSYYILDQNGVVLRRDQGLSTPPGLWLRANL